MEICTAGRGTFNLLSALEGKVEADQRHKGKRVHSFGLATDAGDDVAKHQQTKTAAPLPNSTMFPRHCAEKPALPKAFARHAPKAFGMSKAGAGAGPPMVGPAHLVARHQERQTADSSARPAGAGGRAIHQAAAAVNTNSTHIPSKPLPASAGVYTAAVPSQASMSRTAAEQQGATSTGARPGMPPPSMPRRRLPAGPTTCKPPPPPVLVVGATTASVSTATAAAVASADAAGSKASAQDARQQNAKAYLARLQEGLPAAAYQQLMKHLQRYRKDHDTLQVTDGVLDVLRLPTRRHLLLDFAAFLRTQDRDWFLRCVKQITKEPSEAAAPSSQQIKATKVEQQQPSAPGDFAASQQAPRGLSAQKQGLLQNTGLQSRAAQMVMQQRQAYLQPTSDYLSATVQKRSGT
ncbi:hypothetical protein ABBQ38_004137 [Trebouxia sp. C0009 RCD-2024]